MAADRSLPTVLIVEDDSRVRHLYVEYLEDEYDVRTAASGEAALDVIDDTVDAVLLDRRMPGLSGAETLDRIRDRGFECGVAMVTAVDPDFDIIEMGFDDYLTKPVSQRELIDVVDSLLAQRNYDEIVQEYFTVVSKVTALESQKPQDVLEDSDEYAQLLQRLESIKEDAREALNEAIETGEFESILQRLDE